MKHVTAPLGAVATGEIVPADWKRQQFSASIAVVTTGTNTFKVQHTYDDIMNTTITPTWFDKAAAASINAEFAYSMPVRAWRLNMTAWTSGSAVMTVVQTEGGSN